MKWHKSPPIPVTTVLIQAALKGHDYINVRDRSRIRKDTILWIIEEGGDLTKSIVAELYVLKDPTSDYIKVSSLRDEKRGLPCYMEEGQAVIIGPSFYREPVVETNDYLLQTDRAVRKHFDEKEKP